MSKLRWFFVIARNSSFVYKGKSVHMKETPRNSASAMWSRAACARAATACITVQLNDVATGSHIWAERYDRSLADVFAVQDEITEAIVAAIEPQLYAAENFRARRKPPDSMDAWDLVMRALSHYWRVTRQDNLVAQALLEKAIAIDPNYGQALGVLATSHTFVAHMGWADQARPACRSPSAPRSRQSAPTARSWAHLRLGLSICSAGDLTTRWRMELALRLNPNFARAGLLRRGVVLLRTLAGRLLGRAARVSPEPARPLLGGL